MTYLRSLFSFFLMMTFTFHPAQAGTSAYAQTVAKKLSSYKTFGELAQGLEKKSSPFSKELWQYYKSNDLLNEQIPNFRIKENEFILDVEKNIKVTLHEEKVEVTWGKKQKFFENITSIKEVIQELEGMSKVSSFNFSKYIIDEAHAAWSLSAYIGAVAVIALFGLIYKEDKFIKKAKELERICSETKDIASSSIEDIVEMYNTVSEIYSDKCVREAGQACVALKNALNCYKKMIKSYDGVNADGRNAGKEILYRPQNNTFVIKSKASAM